MSEKPISPLRQRMLEDMSVRRFAPDTQREYILAVKRLAAFLGRTPDTATAEELRAFQLHLTQTGVRPPYGNATREATSLKAISLDIDAVRQSIDRIAANVATGQEQMTRRIEHSIERNTDLLATGQDETTREISDGRTWWGLSRQYAPGDHRDRRSGPVGRVCAITGQWEDRGAGQSGPLRPVARLDC